MTESETSNIRERRRGPTEAELTARIDELNAELVDLCLRRAGMMIDDERAWCCVCGGGIVRPVDGFDTCPECAP